MPINWTRKQTNVWSVTKQQVLNQYEISPIQLTTFEFITNEITWSYQDHMISQHTFSSDETTFIGSRSVILTASSLSVYIIENPKPQSHCIKYNQCLYITFLNVTFPKWRMAANSVNMLYSRRHYVVSLSTPTAHLSWTEGENPNIPNDCTSVPNIFTSSTPSRGTCVP